MKKFKLFLVLLVAVLILPFAVFAEDEAEQAPAEETTGTEEVVSSEEESKEVNVYLFRGEGCPHCQEAEEWFASIEEEYGSYFKIVDYETWYNKDNAKLMQKVASARGEEANGVPYIIIGNKSWNGFADDYKEEMKEAIKSEFETNISERYDVMKLVNNSDSGNKETNSSNDFIALIIILVVVCGVCFGIYKVKSNTK